MFVEIPTEIEDSTKSMRKKFQENYLKETTINDAEQNNNHSYQKYSFGGAYYTDKFDQFMIRFATEADKEYGLKADKEMLIRYRWWFNN